MKKNVTSFLLLSFFFLSCSKSTNDEPPTPIVDFNYSFSGNNNVAPNLVKFTNNTKNATEYQWNFGDSSTVVSSDINPTHVYKTGGTYTVKLSAYNQIGRLSSVAIGTKKITIANTYTKFNINSLTLINQSNRTGFIGFIRITDNTGLANRTIFWQSSNLTITPSSPVVLSPTFVCAIQQVYEIQIWKAGNQPSSNELIANAILFPFSYTDFGGFGLNQYPTALTLDLLYWGSRVPSDIQAAVSWN